MDADAIRILLEARRQLVDQSFALWNFYTVIALGVVGIVYGAKLVQIDRARLPISIGYAIWALANGASLWTNTALLATVTTSMNEAGKSPATPAILKTFLTSVSTSQAWTILAFHIVVDAMVLTAIWLPKFTGSTTEPVAANVPP
jgi:hypothetical protein